MSVYNNSIPGPMDFLSDSQQQMLNNFAQLDVTMAKNHYDFSDNTTNNGKHKFLQMPEQGAAPVTAVNEAAFYSKVGTDPSETNLFFRAENSGFEYQLSRAISASTARFATTQGWTFLPGKLLVQWGQLTNPQTSGSILFATDNINFTTAVYQIMLQLRHNSSATESATVKGDVPPTTTGFSYRTTSSSANTVLYWVAIGI